MITPKEIYNLEEVKELVKKAQDAFSIAKEAVEKLKDFKGE
jgi:hypothetical protein